MYGLKQHGCGEDLIPFIVRPFNGLPMVDASKKGTELLSQTLIPISLQQTQCRRPLMSQTNSKFEISKI